MYNIELRIKLFDWLYILLIGILFATLLSALGYELLGMSWIHGALFGGMLGFSITLFSLIFITFMNQTILPKIPKIFWLPLAIFFSFLSGFLGTLFSTYLANSLSLQLIELFHTQVIEIAIAIGFLTYIVGALLYRFVKMRNAKEVVDQHYVQSRLRSLETQLNPHFLFNALNSIAELIHQDPVKAENAILKVSTFLRNTMEEKARIALNDEIRNVRDYVELENIRFSGKIYFQDIGHIPNLFVPKFSIQLLVENAIKHGFENHKKLSITLSYNKETHALILSNDGKPIKNSSFGTGLSNLEQRLKLLCNGNIKITNKNNPTFTIYLGDCNENTHR
ncbi:MAG: Autolysin sensor kinase (EC [uncultured Sulfurovum sp.]|uniref:Autolysin sensor kinase (EC) n=1 Tax=uncultured Sulfurovum sp. TaxID=269237 RepID=A0A6S6TRZ8_9BACT|nr:MAG: Autolysin sensor kinase (EC [uncultured Sulfurovum sp.]